MLTTIVFLAVAQAKVPKLAPAVFADASTRRIVEMSRKSFAGLKTAKFSVLSEGEMKQYAFSNGKVMGKQKGAQWVWSQKRLDLLCSKGLFRGKMGAYNVNAWLAKVGASPELLPIQLASKKNPIDLLVAPGSRVSLVGSIRMDGVAVDLVEVKTAGLKVTMGIRQDNRLIADLTAVNIGQDGKPLFSSTRTIQWRNVNKPVPANLFAVSAGKTPKPIKSLG